MSTNQSVQHAQLAEKSAEFVEAASTALDTSISVINKYRQDEKQASELVPGIINKLVSLRLIDKGEEKQAAAELSSPQTALLVMSDLLDKYAEQQTAKSAGLGKGVDSDGTAPPQQKKAFHAIGERSFNRDRESDRALARLVGR